MRRESVFACTYAAENGEHVAHVRAWSRREAAELFAREIELDFGADVRIAEIRVTPVFLRDGAERSTAA